MTKKHGKHQTVAPDAKRSVEWLQARSGVSKIVLGKTTGCRHAFTSGWLKFVAFVTTGLKCRLYSGLGVMDLYVHCSMEHRDALRVAIDEKFKV